MWGLSLFMSDSRTGFRKNSSAPSSRHLIQNFKNQNCQFFPLWSYIKHDMLLENNSCNLCFFLKSLNFVFMDMSYLLILFFPKGQQYLLILSLTLVPSHWWSIAQRVVSGASDLSASTDLFHGYGNMKDLQDRTDYHFISFLLVFILHRPGRDIIQGRCELSCMWWFVPLL